MRSLVIKCTAGAEDPERCNQAFTVATAAIASGATVTLWLTGEEDIVYPPFLSGILAKLMPNARVAQMKGAGHSVYFERPAEFNRIVDEFLSALP